MLPAIDEVDDLDLGEEEVIYLDPVGSPLSCSL